jgi:LemA protein
MKSIKKSWIVIAVIVLLIIIMYSSIKSTYNKMVTMDESVTSQWAQVENVYQRRADLIPNLVATVKGYADFEQKTLTDVIEARSKATSVTIDPTNLNEASMAQFQAAQDGLSSALSRLMVVVERYPDLKANLSFLDLQTQLERTENRITVERMNFNTKAQEYNAYIRSFPKNIYASLFGFEKKAYFKAQEGAEKAPEVKF